MPYYVVIDAASGHIVDVDNAQPNAVPAGQMVLQLPARWADTDEFLLRRAAFGAFRAGNHEEALHLRARTRDRTYLMARVSEEVDRSRRGDRPFSILVVTAQPHRGAPEDPRLRRAIEEFILGTRLCDVIAVMSETSLAVLLVDCDAAGAGVALRRVRRSLAGAAGCSVVSLTYPDDAERFEALLRAEESVTTAVDVRRAQTEPFVPSGPGAAPDEVNRRGTGMAASRRAS